jgi:hypothetical protein
MDIEVQYNEFEPYQTTSVVVWLHARDRMILVGGIELTSAGWELRLITEMHGQVDRDLQQVIITTACRDDAILAALCSGRFLERALGQYVH